MLLIFKGERKTKMRKQVFLGFFWKFSEQISSQLVSFIISVILARLLSPSDYGIVALVNVFIIIANVFVTSGLGTALIQKKDSDNIDFSTVFYLSEVLSIIIYGIIYMAAPYIAKFYGNPELIEVTRVFALTLPLSAFNAIQQAYVSKHMLFKKIFISTTVSSISSGIIGIILAYAGFGVWSLVGQTLSNTILISMVLFVQLGWHPQLVFSWNRAKPLISFGWKILASSLLGQIFNQLRTLLLGKAYTSADLAYYNRGQKFPELISSNIDGTISTVLFPALSEYSDDTRKVKELTRISIRTSTFIIMPLMFGMAATAKPIILLLLTSKWAEAIPYMQFLCIAGAFGTVSNANMQAISAIGRSDVMLKLELIKKPLYLILLVIGIKISVLAVAYTMTLYSILAMFLNMSPNRKLLNYKFDEQMIDILPALANSMVLFILVEMIGLLHLQILILFIVQVIIGGVSYIIIAYITKMQAFMYLLDMLFKRSDIKK